MDFITKVESFNYNVFGCGYVNVSPNDTLFFISFSIISSTLISVVFGINVYHVRH